MDQLLLQGSRHGFCVPGESYLEILDALFDHQRDFRLITCRHEGAAANAAAAYGTLTGHAGICFVTRGPGAAHASVGVHTAAQNSSPLILIIGQVPSYQRGREAFQEVDYTDFFSSMAKSVAEAESASQLPELCARAFTIAHAGRPGPVVLSIPEDVLNEVVEIEDQPRSKRVPITPPPAASQQIHDCLLRASNPLVIVGGAGWSSVACDDLHRWATANVLPVASAFRHQDLIDSRSTVAVGELGLGSSDHLLQALGSECDLIIAMGARLDTTTTRRDTLVKAPRPRQALIHIQPEELESRVVFEADLKIVSDVQPLLSQLADLPAVRDRPWEGWTRSLRKSFIANLRPQNVNGPLNLSEVMHELRRQLPDDAVITNGAGNFTGWIHRHFEFRLFPTQLAPQSGAMGYGLPAAVAAAVALPGTKVTCIAGDGDFQMYPAELGTLIQYGLPVLIIVVNNGLYGTIRMHQSRLHPDRSLGTDLVGPSFTAYAAAFGIQAQAVRRTVDFPPALVRALKSIDGGKPALIELKVGAESLEYRAEGLSP